MIRDAPGLPGRQSRDLRQIGGRLIQNLSDPVRILHFTDPHLFADADGDLRGVVTQDSLNAVLLDIQKRNWPADFVIMTGDTVQDDSRAAYERFSKLVLPLELPVYCVPGNHDVRPIMRELLSADPFHYCASLSLGNWFVTGIDSCVEGSAGGRIAGEELDRLASGLAQTDAEHVAICLHHPPLTVGSAWLDRVGLYNSDEFLRLASQAGNVRLILFGHVHQAFEAEHRGMRIVGTPSTCRQFLPASDDFALDDRAPAYRQVSLHAEGTVESQLIWL